MCGNVPNICEGRVTMECVACIEFTDSKVVPCGHPICETCAMRWMDMGKRTCPTCRQPFVTLSSFNEDTPRHGESIVTMCFEDEDDQRVGITLATIVDSSRVVVRRVEPNTIAHRHGIRAKQIITRINSIKVSDHETAIAVVRAARDASIPIVLYVQRPRRFVDVVRTWMYDACRFVTMRAF